jgi:steroid delta-isomerase-like uncharacterized protein
MTGPDRRRIRAAWHAAWNEGDVAAMRDLLAPGYVRHSGGREGRALDRAGLLDVITGVREAFPDLVTSIDDMFGEGDRVAIRWSSVGTNQGAFVGVPSTGRRITTHGITISRFEGDHVAEEWVTWDLTQLLTDLGVLSLRRPA